MINGTITEEIRTIRRQLAAQCNNEVAKILDDVRQREAGDGHHYVTLPKRPKDGVSPTDAGLATDVRRKTI